MKGKYRFSFLHFSLLAGALILQNQWIFFGFAILVGIFPRVRYSFGYYLLLSILAMALALILNPIPAALNESFGEIMGIPDFPFWLIVAIVSVLTLSFIATGINHLLAIEEKEAPAPVEEDPLLGEELSGS